MTAPESVEPPKAGDRLTILLTLKDRIPFTDRWMSYADAVRFPFKVLIADGGTEDGAEKLLAHGRRYPRVDYEYVRYPLDRTYAEYYSKIADALGRVRTPFVALADNDDFFAIGGLARAVEFLAAHPDHASCGGQGAFFWVGSRRTREQRKALYGSRIEGKWSNNTRSITAETAAERIQEQSISFFDPLYYHVRRTEEAKRQFDIQRKLDLKDIFLAEELIHFLTVIAGKAKRLGGLYIARQQDPPESAGQSHEEQYGDCLGRMLLPSWSEDFEKFVGAAAAHLAEKDGLPMDDAREKIVRTYRMLIAPELLHLMGQEPTVTALMAVAAPLTRRLIRMPEDRWIRRAAKRLFRRSRWLSFDAVYGAEILAKPVAEAAEEFRPILEFLAAGGA